MVSAIRDRAYAEASGRWSALVAHDGTRSNDSAAGDAVEDMLGQAAMHGDSSHARRGDAPDVPVHLRRCFMDLLDVWNICDAVIVAQATCNAK